MTENIIASRRMDDGTEYRARLLPDTDPGEPHDDGQWPILRIETHSALFFHGYVAVAYNDAAAPYVAAFNTLSQKGHDVEVFQRYLRIFHDTIRPDKKFGEAFKQYSPNQGADTYLAFAPRKWREFMGVDIEQCMSEDPLTEIVAWSEGDVWGVATETRWNPDSDKGDDEDDWEPLESVWGFYGRKWAEETARTELESAIRHHKVVHRYPEHEKLVAHETEVRAILEFLEVPGEKLALATWKPTISRWEPVADSSHQRIVYAHFGIDYDKITQERDLMVKRLQEEASTS